MTGLARPQLRALDLARALAGTGPASVLESLLDVLSADDAEAIRAWQVLVHGGLAPLAAHVLAGGGQLASAAPRLREALQSALEVNAVRNAVLRRAAVEASRALGTAGLTPLWAKGIWLAHAVYPQPALRTMSDIDLIVPEGSRADARRVLEQLGYVAEDAHQGGAAAWTDTMTAPAANPGDVTVQIDLHDSIRLSAAHAWPVARLWDGAQHARVARADVRMPRREAGLLYLAVHLFKHGFDLRHALVAVADAAALLRDDQRALDVGWLDRQLDDPRDATALYLLLALLGTCPTPTSRALRARLGERLDAHGLRVRADALLASAERQTLSSATDFSLFDVGEQASVGRALVSVLAGMRRWQRRAHAPVAPAAQTRPRWPVLLRRANWRHAYTTFLAGRLHARLTAGRR